MNIKADEYLLLLRNRLPASSSFLKIDDWGVFDAKGLTHAYVIVSSKLLQLW